MAHNLLRTVTSGTWRPHYDAEMTMQQGPARRSLIQHTSDYKTDGIRMGIKPIKY